ncbi:MAG: hypothetical protein S4CHLAM6_08510 [Chlamydiae bacterium]|nr:hypothetical protein [Chlamydiota bacterium]
MTTPIDTLQPATNIASLPKQSPLTTISKTVGLDSIYSSLHSFADRDYRKSCTHLTEGIIRLTATAALTMLAIVASYETRHYYLKTQLNNVLFDIDNALDNNNTNLAMQYARKIHLSTGFEKIVRFCLGNKDVECAIETATKIDAGNSRDRQLYRIFAHCLMEENIECAMKAATTDDDFKDITKLYLGKGNIEGAMKAALKMSSEASRNQQFGDITKYYLRVGDTEGAMKAATTDDDFEDITKFCLGKGNTDGAMKATLKMSSGYLRAGQFETIAGYCIGQEDIKCALTAVENIGALYRKEPLERLNKLCEAKNDTECVIRTHKEKEQEQANHNFSNESAGLETLKILGIDSVSLLSSIPDDKAEDEQFIERKCAKVLRVMHPDKSSTSGDAFVSFVKMCTNAVMAIKQ